MLDKDEPLEKQTADLGGVKVAYTDMGKGDPILFVHGIPTSSYLWRNLIRPLSDDYRCIAPDLMGLGDTETPLDHRYDMEAQADKLIELADHLELDKFSLVCHDQGGAAAQWLAVNNPERIERFIITNCVCYDNWPVPEVAMGMKVVKIIFLFELGYKLSVTKWSILRNIMRRGIHDRSKMSDDAIDEYSKWSRMGRDKAEQFRLFALAGDCKYSVEAAKKFGEFKKPTYVIWAGNDPFLSPSWGRKLYDDIAGSKRMEIMPFAGHFWQEEIPELGAKYIKEFMEDS